MCSWLLTILNLVCFFFLYGNSKNITNVIWYYKYSSFWLSPFSFYRTIVLPQRIIKFHSTPFPCSKLSGPNVSQRTSFRTLTAHHYHSLSKLQVWMTCWTQVCVGWICTKANTFSHYCFTRFCSVKIYTSPLPHPQTAAIDTCTCQHALSPPHKHIETFLPTSVKHGVRK
jgi:hypothetical protein